MKKIFLASQSLKAGNGGIARVARLMARVLAEEQENGRLSFQSLTFKDLTQPQDILSNGRLARGSKLRFIYEIQKATINHSHFIYDFLGMSRAHLPIPFFYRPHMTWLHGVEIWSRERADRIASARRADLLLCNSNYTLKQAELLHEEQFAKAKICWLGTETDDFPMSSNDIRRRQPTVLTVGRIEKGRDKGLSSLVESWPRVVQEVPDAQLIIVGKGTGLNEIKDQIKCSSVNLKIELKGFVPDPELEKIFSESLVFAMPSRGEGFGLVYIEAMRHGLPVIASVHDAAPEINIHGKTGFNVNLDKPNELVEKLVFLLKNPKAAYQLGENGKQRWVQNFCFSAFRSRYVALLKEFLDSN